MRPTKFVLAKSLTSTSVLVPLRTGYAYLFHVVIRYLLARKASLLGDHQVTFLVKIGASQYESLSFDLGGTLVPASNECNDEEDDAGAHGLQSLSDPSSGALDKY